jgi:hypothetical protein
VDAFGSASSLASPTSNLGKIADLLVGGAEQEADRRTYERVVSDIANELRASRQALSIDAIVKTLRADPEVDLARIILRADKEGRLTIGKNTDGVVFVGLPPQVL